MSIESGHIQDSFVYGVRPHINPKPIPWWRRIIGKMTGRYKQIKGCDFGGNRYTCVTALLDTKTGCLHVVKEESFDKQSKEIKL